MSYRATGIQSGFTFIRISFFLNSSVNRLLNRHSTIKGGYIMITKCYSSSNNSNKNFFPKTFIVFEIEGNFHV